MKSGNRGNKRNKIGEKASGVSSVSMFFQEYTKAI